MSQHTSTQARPAISTHLLQLSQGLTACLSVENMGCPNARKQVAPTAGRAKQSPTACLKDDAITTTEKNPAVTRTGACHRSQRCIAFWCRMSDKAPGGFQLFVLALFGRDPGLQEKTCWRSGAFWRGQHGADTNSSEEHAYQVLVYRLPDQTTHFYILHILRAQFFGVADCRCLNSCREWVHIHMNSLFMYQGHRARHSDTGH